MKRQESSVLVRGDGVAAYCSAHLLQEAGIPVVLHRASAASPAALHPGHARTRLPAIMLSESALGFIADIIRA